MSNKFLMAALVTGFAGLLVLGGCKSGAQIASAKDAGGAASTVTFGPEESLQIPTLEGANSSVEQYKGKVVLVNFWATWCQPCNIEIPWLIEFNQKYGPKGLVILGVAMDEEGKRVVDPWVKSKHFDVNGHPELMNYQILIGDDKIADKFGASFGLPTSVLYSRDGRKIKTIIGLADYKDLSKVLEGQL